MAYKHELVGMQETALQTVVWWSQPPKKYQVCPAALDGQMLTCRAWSRLLSAAACGPILREQHNRALNIPPIPLWMGYAGWKPKQHISLPPPPPIQKEEHEGIIGVWEERGASVLSFSQQNIMGWPRWHENKAALLPGTKRGLRARRGEWGDPDCTIS